MKNLKFEPIVWGLPKAMKELNLKFDLQNPDNEDEKMVKEEYYKIISEPYLWEEPRIVLISGKFEPFSSQSFPYMKSRIIEDNDIIFLKDLLEVIKKHSSAFI